MVHCKHCSTNNSLDSTFCKKCGTGLPEEDIAAAAAKLDVLLSEGNSKLNEGKVAEAMAIAEAGVEIDPSSVIALSLKANCHERKGEIAEALECAERIVELNPDSELDKIRRNQLRSALVLHAQPASGADRRFAAIAAIAAVLLVVCGGIIAVKLMNPAVKPTSDGLLAQNERPAVEASQNGGASSPPSNVETNKSGSTSEPGANQAPATQPITQNTARPTPDLSNVKPTDTLPVPDRGESGPLEVRPVIPQGPRNNTSLPPANPTSEPVKTSKSSDPDPEPIKDSAANPTVVPPQKDPGGEISINVHSTRPKLPGGSESVDPTPASVGGAKAYSRVGNEQFMLGNYAAAASSLERALQSGGDPISVNQRLGQAYQRLGRKSDASGAYQRAIQAADRAISSGKGDKERLTSLKESCQAALRVVGN